MIEDIRNTPDRFIRIADEDGLETWLDLETGFFTYLTSGAETAFPSPEDASPMFEESTGEESASDEIFSRPLMDTMRAMLDGYGYRYSQLDEVSLHLVVRGSKGMNSLFITVDDARDYIRVVGSYGPGVPAERRIAVAEAVSRVNVCLGHGNFELDFSDGELRYRISMDIEGGLFGEKVADNMVGCTLHTMDRYADALMRVAFGDVEPEQAVREFVT